MLFAAQWPPMTVPLMCANIELISQLILICDFEHIFSISCIL